jgi:type II secretory pathway component PulF
MPVYVYRGTNRAGGAVSGEQVAGSKAELMSLLQRQQIKVNKMSEKVKSSTCPPLEEGTLTPRIWPFSHANFRS